MTNRKIKRKKLFRIKLCLLYYDLFVQLLNFGCRLSMVHMNMELKHRYNPETTLRELNLLNEILNLQIEKHFFFSQKLLFQVKNINFNFHH